MPLLLSSKIPSILIMGNADFKVNMQYYKDLSNKYNNHFRFLNSGETLELNKEYVLFVYSYIPIGNKQLKDWEKLDSNGFHDKTYSMIKFLDHFLKF
jgi:hypothetical protein